MRVKIPLVSCANLPEAIHSLTIFNNVDEIQKEKAMKVTAGLLPIFLIASLMPAHADETHDVMVGQIFSKQLTMCNGVYSLVKESSMGVFDAIGLTGTGSLTYEPRDGRAGIFMIRCDEGSKKKEERFTFRVQRPALVEQTLSLGNKACESINLSTGNSPFYTSYHLSAYGSAQNGTATIDGKTLTYCKEKNVSTDALKYYGLLDYTSGEVFNANVVINMQPAVFATRDISVAAPSNGVVVFDFQDYYRDQQINGKPLFRNFQFCGQTPSQGTASYNGWTFQAAQYVFDPKTVSGSDAFEYCVIDNGGNISAPAKITVNFAAPINIILDDPALSATVNTPFSYKFTTSGGKAPYTYQVVGGALPGGLTFAGDTLSGTPTSVNTHQFDLRVTDADGVHATKSFDIEIKKDMRPPVADDFTLSVSSRDTGTWIPFDVRDHVTNYGDPADQINVKSASAVGVDFNISGLGGQIFVPISAVGSVQVQYTVSNSISSVESNIATITINLADPVVTIDRLQQSVPIVGQPYQARFVASGAASPYTYSISGDVPAGLSWNEISNSGGSATYELSGTPTRGGMYNFNLTVIDANGFSSTLPISIDLGKDLSASDATLDVAYGGTVSVDLADYIEGTYKSIEVATDHLYGYATLSGTVLTYTSPDSSKPLAISDNIGFTAVFDNNLVGGRASATLTLNLLPPAAPTAIPFSVVADRVNGVEFNLFDHYQKSFFDVNYTMVVGTPSSGVVLDLGNGRFQYKPDPMNLAAHTVHLQFVVQDTYFVSAPATITVEVPERKTVSLQGALVTGKVGEPIQHIITVNGGVAPFHIAPMMGGLPDGLSINGETIEGSPTTEGVFMIMIGVRDAEGTVGSGMFRFEIAPADAVVEVTLPALSLSGKVGNQFIQQFTADGGSEPYTFAVVNALPDGLALNGDTVSGTPTAEGNFSFELQATDADGIVGTQVYTIIIAPSDPVISLPTASDGSLTLEYGETGEISLTGLVSGDVDAISIVSQPSKGVVKFDGNKATYVPNEGATGNDKFVFTATNAAGSVSGTVTITISAPVVVGDAPVAKDHVVRLEPLQAGSVVMTEGAVSVDPINKAHVLTSVAKSEGSTKVFDKEIKFTPNKAFAGQTVVSYQLENKWGRSNVATITFVMAPRPDPSKDAEVAALIKAQMDAAIKLDSDQVDNITKRIEQIRSEAPGQRLNSVSWDLGVNSTDIKDDEDTSKDSTSLQGEFRSENSLAIWSTGYIRLGEHDDGKIDFSTTAYGGTAGLDYRFSETFVGGVAVGYGREVAEIGSNGTENEAQAISGALYGTWHNQSGAFIDGILGYSHLTMDSSRYVTSNGGIAYGSRTGSTVFGSVIGGYRFETENGLKIEPYAGFRGVAGKLNGSTETGADWNNLAYGDTNISSLKAVAGLRLEQDFEMNDFLITPSAKVEYRHELAGSTTTSLGYADLGTMPYSVTTEASETKTVVATVGVRVKPKGSNLAIEGNVQANFNGSAKPSTTYSVKLSGHFCGFASKEGDCMSREEKVVYFKAELVKAKKAKNKPRITEVSKLLANAEADLLEWKKLTKNAKPLPELLYVDTISGKPSKR